MPNYEQEAHSLPRLEVYSALDSFFSAHNVKELRQWRSSVAKRIIGQFWAKRGEFCELINRSKENAQKT